MEKVMDIFKATKEVIKEYQEKSNRLKERISLLNKEIEKLQEQHIAITLDQRGTEDIGEKVYLRKQAKVTINETEIIQTMIEELKEEQVDLKLGYTPVLINAIEKDRKAVAYNYSANEIVNKYRYQMLEEITSIGKQMQDQVSSITLDVAEVLGDTAVNEKFPRLEYVFNAEHYKPAYAESNNTVISRYDVFMATSGQMPNIPKPKEVNEFSK